jgi:luciferase family oxidoreductase group 1
MIPFSVLDLAPIVQGSNATTALKNSVDLAQHAEKWNYKRFWLAEHHNMVGIASAATSVVIGHVAANTKTIRVGSGGIMLPNHAPLVIAEQFGTLEAFFPGRIDLGLGRAPGTDGLTSRALRRDLNVSSEQFPRDVQELQAYLEPAGENQRVQAIPGAGSRVPIWILGSSLFGAQLAAALGLPFGFASHFAPDALMQALHIYRDRFKPSAQLQKPYAMVGVNTLAADTDDEAKHLFTSVQMAFTNMHRGTRQQLSPPIANIDDYWTPGEKASVEHMLAYSVVGSVNTVSTKFKELIAATQADELMVTTSCHDHKKRLRSFELVAQARDLLNG